MTVARTQRTVADAMLHAPKVSPAGVSVATVRRMLADDHVHAVLLVERGILMAVCERGDLDQAMSDDQGAAALGRLRGRLVSPSAGLESTRLSMRRERRRRLVVVDPDGHLVGLLCLKQSGAGFCSDADVAARAAGRTIGACGTP